LANEIQSRIEVRTSAIMRCSSTSAEEYAEWT